MSQAPEMITVSNHNIITERNNVYVFEREKERRGKGEANERDRTSAHKTNLNLKSWELWKGGGGATLEKVAEVERAVREKA